LWDKSELEKFTCVASDDIYFDGSFQTEESNYFHFELVKCEEERLRAESGD